MELQELEKKYQELGKEIEALKAQKEEVKYPIYCLSKTGKGLIVKFDGLTSGTVVKNSKDNVGLNCGHWVKHTDAYYWEQLEVCEKTGFYDGQLVWCWDKDDTHKRFLGFYDIKNKGTFTFGGRSGGFGRDNYEPYEGNWPQWAQKAFKTLER